MSLLSSFPEGYRVLILGASGALGAAFVELLSADPRCGAVIGLHRQSVPALNFSDESSVAQAAYSLRNKGPFHLIVNAVGILHTEQFMPEKKLDQLHYSQMLETFKVNTFGPALVMAHFSPLLDARRGILAVLSAKVGSITDNRLGGWYSYRASKAALNMVLKTAAVEVRRSQPSAILVALHPGTVSSALSSPFRGDEIGRLPQDSVTDLLRVLDGLTPADTGRFYAYSGQEIPW